MRLRTDCRHLARRILFPAHTQLIDRTIDTSYTSNFELSQNKSQRSVIPFYAHNQFHRLFGTVRLMHRRKKIYDNAKIKCTALLFKLYSITITTENQHNPVFANYIHNSFIDIKLTFLIIETF